MAMETVIGRWGVIAGALAALASGCGDIGEDGCDSDAVCKGARICSRGVCVDPDHVSSDVGLSGAPTDDDLPMGGVGGDDPPIMSDGGIEPELSDAAVIDDGGRPSDVEYVCIVGGEGACQNAVDCPSLEDGTAKAVAQECGIECATSPDPGCAGSCIQSRSDLTMGCSGCLEAFFDCLLANCLAPCLSGTSDDCGTCSREKPADESCSDQLLVCSGVELNPDYVAQ